MKDPSAYLASLFVILALSGVAHASSAEIVFPGETWAMKAPGELSLDAGKLDDFAARVGGDGVIIKDGFLVKFWGEHAARQDWASAAKPVLSTLLLLAVKEGRLASVDALVKDANWALSEKDAPMTYRHLANMVSGYACAEPPGEAWGYNDLAIQLYAKSLERVFEATLDQALQRRLGALRSQDGAFFGSRGGRGVRASPRDFGRLGWLWLNRGLWNERQLIPERLFRDCIRPGVPVALPRTQGQGKDYLGVGSYGGGRNQTRHGPGVYGFNFWFNEPATRGGQRVWPALPPDAFQANGMWNRDTVTVIPSRRMVIAVRGAKLGPFEPGKADGVANQNFRLLMDALQTSAPYPPSPVVAGIEWAPLDAIVRLAKGSDNFPLTWSDDDALYTTYGDGFGFEPFVSTKLSLGLARITGMPGNIQATNLRSPSIEQVGDGRKGRKGWGLLSVNGVLYLWLGHADRNGGQARLAWSKDHGGTWTHADWRFAEFGLVGFINFGKDYAGARDEFVYAYSHDGPRADRPADRFILMRAPKEQLSRREAWRFFVRRDEGGGPVWSKDIQQRGSVFEHREACLRSAITFNAPLNRYLWWQAIPQPHGHKDRGDTRFDGGFGIYDAPEPWGPWTTVYFTRQWDTGPGEHGDFPSKWMSADGRSLHLVFSGEDHFCVRQAKLTPRSTSESRFDQ